MLDLVTPYSRGMHRFCDVALPVPIDQAFTYAVQADVPVVGARVLVPFGGQRLVGVVVGFGFTMRRPKASR